MRPWANHPLGRAVKVLSHADRRKLIAVTALLVLMGGLDLLGVIAIGLLGALSDLIEVVLEE